MPIHGLYAITDPTLSLSTKRLLEHCEQALRGGVRCLQYRNKQANQATQRSETLVLAQLCKQYQCTFLINDNPELAKHCQADGVHLGRNDEHYQHARDYLGPQAIIGLTCHQDIEYAQSMQALGANYVAFGRFFASKTKPQAPACPLTVLEQAKSLLTIPVVAIGGITVDNAPQLIQRGADSLAVINDLFTADNIELRAQQYQSLFSTKA